MWDALMDNTLHIVATPFWTTIPFAGQTVQSNPTMQYLIELVGPVMHHLNFGLEQKRNLSNKLWKIQHLDYTNNETKSLLPRASTILLAEFEKSCNGTLKRLVHLDQRTGLSHELVHKGLSFPQNEVAITGLENQASCTKKQLQH